MQFAIISDVHDNLANLAKTLNFFKKSGVNFLICCGDIGNLETIFYLTENFSGQIYLAFGNVERDFINKDELNFSNLTVYNDFGEIELDGKKIAFCHFPQIARQLAKNGNADFIFYGHTHQPNQKSINKKQLINPGNIAGLLFKPTFALYRTETEKLELKLIDLI